MPTRARVRHFQQVDAAQQRALAAAGGADQRGHAAFGDGKADALEHVIVAEALVDVVERDHDAASMKPP